MNYVPRCSCAKYDPEEGRYQCSLTGQCVFMIPDAVLCAKRYGEGPMKDIVPEEGEKSCGNLQT